MTKECVAVINESGEAYPIEQAADIRGWVSQVVWADGSRSWGKSWKFGSRYPEAMRCTTSIIGAGSSGQMVVWQHPVLLARRDAEAFFTPAWE